MIENLMSETTGATATETPVSTILEAAEMGRQIGASFQKAANDVLASASLCAVAYERHSSMGLSTVLRYAQMGKATFLKLVRIGRDQRLPPITTRLPPSYSIMYEVSQLDDQQLGLAIKADMIRPDVRRAEIVALRKPSNRKAGTVQKTGGEEAPIAVPMDASDATHKRMSVSAGRRFELRVPPSASKEAFNRIQTMLERLHSEFGVEILPLG